MKKFSIIMMCFATLAFASCSSSSLSTSNTTSSTAAKDSGKSSARALVTLYNSYKNTGTINLGNPTDLTAALNLATGYTNIRNNHSDPNYKKAFASGMVAAGAGLITTANVYTIIDKMNTLTGLNINASTISNSVGTATAIIQLLQALGSVPLAQ